MAATETRVRTPVAVEVARRRAVEAQLHAEELEKSARQARRTATARLRHYEDLLREWSSEQ